MNSKSNCFAFQFDRTSSSQTFIEISKTPIEKPLSKKRTSRKKELLEPFGDP